MAALSASLLEKAPATSAGVTSTGFFGGDITSKKVLATGAGVATLERGAFPWVVGGEIISKKVLVAVAGLLL